MIGKCVGKIYETRYEFKYRQNNRLNFLMLLFLFLKNQYYSFNFQNASKIKPLFESFHITFKLTNKIYEFKSKRKDKISKQA